MPNALLLCQDEEEEEGFSSMEEKLCTLHPDSPLTAWRRLMKRKYTSKTFTNSKESSRKAFGGFWRWLARRNLQAGSGRPRLETSDQLHMCPSAVQPRFTRSMLRGRCSLDDGELLSPHKRRVLGRLFLEARPSPVDLPASDTSQGVREGEDNGEPGSCNVFRALRRHTAPELRIHFGEESDSDLEELLVEDGDDGGAVETD